MDNQRRSFRLDVEVGFEAKLLSEARMRSGIEELRKRPNWSATLPGALSEVDVALQALLDELRPTSPNTVAAMELLNQKLDLIRLGQHWHNNVRDLPLRRINLSATGLAFDYKHEIEVGRAMQLTLTLPSIAWSMVLYARAVSVRPLEEGGYRVALDFEYIRDEDSEQLIRFNLQQQQQVLATKD